MAWARTRKAVVEMGDPNYRRTTGRNNRLAWRPRAVGNIRAFADGSKYEVMPNGQWRKIGKVLPAADNSAAGVKGKG